MEVALPIGTFILGFIAALAVIMFMKGGKGDDS